MREQTAGGGSLEQATSTEPPELDTLRKWLGTKLAAGCGKAKSQ
jgi:hypothetical protein